MGIALGLVVLNPGAGRLIAQSAKLWQRREAPPQDQTTLSSQLRPQKFQAFRLDRGTLALRLAAAPGEFAAAAQRTPAEIELPMPDGSLTTFQFVESPVMAPELAAKYPELRTYLGRRKDDPAETVRFDITPSGFHGYVRSRLGLVCIDPVAGGDATLHAAYFKADQDIPADEWRCLTAATDRLRAEGGAPAPLVISGSQLRTYRLACAATAEYTQNHGGTVKAGLAAIVTIVNRVNAIYEPETAIRFVLVASNDQIVYTNAATDPYTDGPGNESTLLGQNQANLDAVIGDANYDIGHVLTTASGGLAAVAVVCATGTKALAQTGRGNASVDAFYVDYVAHEIGHQFSARHTFNSTSGSCGGGNREPSTAYEPGSGSTIMSYGGNCLGDNIQARSDLYFHAISLDQIIGFSTTGGGNSCPGLNATGNLPPVVSAGPNYSIPQSTPFMLTASGSDPDGDVVTYCWEEMDLGPATTLAAADNGSSPLFRSIKPTTNPGRVFPKLQDILDNAATPTEKLPTTSRTLNFRVTARDNRLGGGGVNTANLQLTVVSGAGPFALTSHNTGGSYSNTSTVTWNVAGTASAPINTALVNIWLSTNNGQTFPHPLVLNTPNDGSEVVTLPSLSSTIARLKIEAVGNVFFDIGNTQFTITPVPPVPVLAFSAAALTAESCAPANSSVDAGEAVTMNFSLRNNTITKTTNLVATLLATGGVTVPGAAQTYGAINGGGTVTKPFAFTANGVCGGSITATLQLQDNSLNLGTVTRTINLGSSNTNIINRTNTTALTIPASGTQGAASLYPSTIAVSGITGVVTKVRVVLTGLTHAYAGDLDVLLVGPTGQGVVLMSDAGNGTNITGTTLTFDDSVSAVLVPEGRIVTSTNQPTEYDPGSDNFPAPAPAGPYGQSLAAFNGLNPNGIWSLYVNDDAVLDSGSLTQGWRLSLTQSNLVCCGSAPNAAPVISAVADLATAEDTPTAAVPFTIYDAETPAAALTLTAASSDTNLVPVTGISLGGSGTNRTVTVSPATNASGSATITVTVDDGVNFTSEPFLLTVNAVNDRPVLVAVADRTVHAGTVVLLTNVASDVESPPQTLGFSFAASPPLAAAVNPANGVFQWPTADADAGTTNTIGVRVTDNGAPPLSATNTFKVTVLARPILQSIAVTNQVIWLRWNAITGQKYRVQLKTNLSQANWSNLAPEIVATGPLASATNATSVGTRQFYRVMLVP